MRILQDTKLDFNDVLLVPKRSTIKTRKDVDLSRFFTFRNKVTWLGTPIMSSNMASVTTPAIADILSEKMMLACYAKGTFVPNGPNRVPTFGLSGGKVFFKWNEYPNFLSNRFVCLDVANGYMESFIERVREMRDLWSDKVIIAGNVVTPEMTEALLLAGADIVKVGIGSGAACSTRIKTGVGYPQLSAVIECADAAHGLGGHVISDGGCVTPGDVVKAFAAGADFVMLGSMLAGHNENGQDHYGMASNRAATAVAGGLKDYRASEGWELRLPNRGPLEATLQEILGGLRSACAYVGARRIKDLPKCATFARVNRQANTSLWEHRI